MAKLLKILRDALKCIDVMLFGYPEEQERLLRGENVNDIWHGTDTGS